MEDIRNKEVLHQTTETLPLDNTGGEQLPHREKTESLYSTEAIDQSRETDIESTPYDNGHTHIKQIVENQKITYQQNPIQKPLSPQLEKKYGWLLSIPEEQRVDIAQKLITTKGKDILEVIHAFLAIDDYVGLDRLEESLNLVYPTLIQEGVLTDIHNK